jgi:hypothetical protein
MDLEPVEEWRSQDVAVSHVSVSKEMGNLLMMLAVKSLAPLPNLCHHRSICVCHNLMASLNSVALYRGRESNDALTTQTNIYSMVYEIIGCL